MANTGFPYLDDLKAMLTTAAQLNKSIDRSEKSTDHPAMTDLTRHEVDAKLGQNKAEVDARLANFDTSVKTGFADLRAEFAGLRTEMANMRTDTAKQNHDSVRWIVGAIFGMLSISVAIIGVMINYSKGGKTPVASPAPIVIYAQPGPAPAAAPAERAATPPGP